MPKLGAFCPAKYILKIVMAMLVPLQTPSLVLSGVEENLIIGQEEID